MNLPLLSLLIWLPVIAAAFVLMTSNSHNVLRAKILSLITVLLTLGLCVPLYLGFDLSTSAMQFTEHMPWIPSFGISYDLGVDGLSMPLIILTVITNLFVVLAAWRSVNQRVSQYLAAFLVMQGLMCGVFAALDGILFYVFWEASLIPMYLIIGIWGSSNRIYAAIKFFLFTFLGSVLMLVALLYLGFKAGNFSILGFYPLQLGMTAQTLIFLGFLLAFAIKVPMWPVHTWLPDAHTEAPAGGSVVLAAIMLKMGGYGLLRFNLPITPDASRSLDWLIIGLSLVAVVYIALVALVQRDMKKLIAYSSIAHMGFVTLATFVIFKIFKHAGTMADAVFALEGGMILMISHAFVSGALFLGVGVLYDRMHTRDIGDFGGVAHKMPIFAAFFMLFALANVGLPGTSGFVGEFMVILAVFKASFWLALLAGTTLILAPAYTLWMYKRVFFLKVANDNVDKLKDLHGFEITVFSLLALFVVVIGLYPKPVLDIFHATFQHIVELSQLSKL